MKKVLLITYDFPPARTSGIYRPTKFVKHLAKFGWEPIVLTARNPYVAAYDTTLMKDIPPGTRVHRVFSPDLARISDALHRLLFGSSGSEPLRETRTGNTSGKGIQDETTPKKNWLKRRVVSPLNRLFVTWGYLPDAKILWFPFALFKALVLVFREKPQVLYSTSYPPTAQLVGLIVKLITRKPWVADFRDNWIVGYPECCPSASRRRLDEWVLKRFLTHADRVITMCRGNASDLLRKYPDIEAGKFLAITNGYDANDFLDAPAACERPNEGRMVLLHVGTLYAGAAGLFFQVLAELFAEQPYLREHVEIRFIGYLFGEYHGLIPTLGLSDTVQLEGFRAHPEALQAMQKADVLLMFLGGHKIMNQQFPGKVFEYMFARKVILTIGQPGEIADTVTKSRCGILALHNDIPAIKQALMELYLRKKAGTLAVDPDMEFIRSFEYANITARFAAVLEEAAPPPPHMLGSPRAHDATRRP